MTRITFNFLQMFAFYMLLQVTFAFRILSANIMITLATLARTMSVTLVLPANTMVTLVSRRAWNALNINKESSHIEILVNLLAFRMS